MSSTSYKKAIQGRAHKERSQPSDRKKFGLLEKHKDYVLRAKDFHRKENAIQLLREKAEFRNPDEFYFGMQTSGTKGGVHVQRSTEENKYSHEQLLLMKTQDKKYIEMKAQSESKKIQKLKASLHFLGGPKLNKHTVFVDTEEEKQNFKPEKYFDTAHEFVERAFHRPTTSQLEEEPPQPLLKSHNKKKATAYKELVQRVHRQKEMAKIAQKMSLDKDVMGKGRKRKIKKASENGGMPVYKWKKERKK